ncbi:LacI family DNA-binding transcriptional regulator [Opitutus sp. ER46]|uniref:LacI family DNA-binding transcriptional regulator n=1 Tax=Opitutus sp. ER46 TaxID=2161864 RepID=UPI000D314EEB|nr:LacI family DNA-binding transcriptional regulator [Opitutus sp. ER46]PTX91050.1 LacI family transcriptional regulator [Opitutus sp. ER46]
MSNEPRPTIRSLARQLNLSRTSVSEALRNHPRVNAETRQRVQAAASAAGYRVNPLASSILSELRRTRLTAFHGVLAVVSLEEPSRPRFPGPYWRDLLKGASDRAQGLGFILERFLVGEQGVSVHRLDTILQSRGIRGVLIMPAWGRPDFSHLNWANYTGVYTDYLIDAPALHSVCPDHPRAMSTAMGQLAELGYKRPGLVLQAQESLRLQHRWAGAFLAAVQLRDEFESVPPLVVPEITADGFKRWFKRTRPDVVLGHRAEIVEWMRECGADVPRTHGFCCLNVSINSIPCAGIDQQPYHIGVRGIETVVSQLHRNEYGIPDVPCNLTVPARWVNGPTLPKRVDARRVKKEAAAR